MGLSESKAETGGKFVGGWLGAVGGLVVGTICPPLAPAAYSYAAVSYCYGTVSYVRGLLTNGLPEGEIKDFVSGSADAVFIGGKLKAGVDFKDDDNKPHLHLCDVNANPIEIREKQEYKEKTEKILIIESKKQDAIKLNSYMYKWEMELQNINQETYNDNQWRIMNTYISSNFERKPSGFEDHQCIPSITYLSTLYFQTKHYEYPEFMFAPTNKSFMSLYTKTNIPTELALKYTSLFSKNYKCRDTLEIISNNLEFIEKSYRELRKINSEKWEKMFSSLFVASIYAMNAMSSLKDMTMDLHGTSYLSRNDESLRHYAYRSMIAIKMCVKNFKDILKYNNKVVKLEKLQDDMYDRVSYIKARERSSMVRKYGIYFDSEKHKLNKLEKIKVVEEYLKESKTYKFNSNLHHELILKMLKECIEIIKD